METLSYNGNCSGKWIKRMNRNKVHSRVTEQTCIIFHIDLCHYDGCTTTFISQLLNRIMLKKINCLQDRDTSLYHCQKTNYFGPEVHLMTRRAR